MPFGWKTQGFEAGAEHMTDLTNPERGGVGAVPLGAGAVRTAFIATICLSALLLFLIQPMFSKMALPLLGGAPNVWTTAMLFFQTILLAGYAYAHWLGTKTSVKTQIIVHLGITLAATMLLPIGIASGWTPPTTGDATLWLLGLFAVSLGAPFFALSANAPLLQKWYAATGGKDADDPYFLYAASNVGSFGALMAYPFVLEPMFGASAQSQTWTYGYFALIVGLILCGWIAGRGAEAMPAETSNQAEATAKPTVRELAIWIALAFLPSSLMLSITAKISTDVGSFPLIWTVTLALYLLSYVFAFSSKLRPSATMMRLVNVPLVLASLALTLTNTHLSGNIMLVILCALLLSVALTCHAALADRRPSEHHLTRFYLAMSVGGALGGLFNSIVAPLVFNDVYEYPIVLALVLLAAPSARFAVSEDLKKALPVAGVLVVLVAGIAALVMTEIVPEVAAFLPIALFFAVCIAWLDYPLRLATLAVGLVGASLLSQIVTDDRVKQRSFFGVYKVWTDADTQIRKIAHGTTVHGSQRLTGDVLKPLSYYHPATPMGQVTQARAKDARVAVVGLGAGSLACYHRGAVDWTFYEIDPLVDRIARDPSQFTFMSECAGDAPTLLGDARLRMTEADKAAFDLIVLDAFSSDAVPVHLLTVEAMQLYRDKMDDQAVMAIHISNRYFDLAGPIAAVAETVGMSVKLQLFQPTLTEAEDGALASHVLLLAKSNDTFGALADDPRWQAIAASTNRVWTDDYANVLSALK
jgi:spermidine synthase